MSNKLAKKDTSTQALLQSDDFRTRIANALPRHITPDRMIAVGLTAINKTPLLAKCTQSSFFQAMLSLSQLGLEPDGRQAHLIPFKNGKTGGYDVQLIIDYKGLVHMARKSGEISIIHADIVCDNDDFLFNLGQVEKHIIDWKKPRGEMYAAYALVQFKDGSRQAEVMSKHEIDAIRARSKAGNFGPWQTDYNEMAKKTVFKRLAKWLPMSSEYRDALSYDDDGLDLPKITTPVIDLIDEGEEADTKPDTLEGKAIEAAKEVKDKGVKNKSEPEEQAELLEAETEQYQDDKR